MPTLHWLTRDKDIRAAASVPYRLLREASELSAGEASTGNMLIQGDNLEALKALLPFYAGQVKCIYIDPPYNTRSAFEHYDDNLEHTQWLALMWPRLELLRELLAEDGSIWVSIDDNEAHYLKVVMDEIVGRKNFVSNVVWQKRTSPDFRSVLGDGHENLLVCSKNTSLFRDKANLLPLSERQRNEYKNPDDDPRGPWVSRDFSAQGYRPNQMYKIVTPGGIEYYPPEGSCWKNIESIFQKQVEEGRFWFGKDGKGVPRRKNYLSEATGRQSWTWWPNEDVGNTQEAKREIIDLFGKSEVFDTPKPERLIQRILHIATNPGDLVLDSFLGSGTTAAVAHKMGRRYIGIEMGEHAVTHCRPRLQKVIDGEQGGISKAVNWQGGGGFRFYRLGPTVFDETGQIRRDIDFEALAAHVWFSETKRPWNGTGESPLLGLYDGHAYALLYNGILGDKRPAGGNVLIRATLDRIRQEIARLHTGFDGKLTIYGEQSRLTPATLERENIVFKQMPYDLKAQT
ncbi:MAG: site-specific DNA-methyltransferase [Gammaproteobacteria bacterium]|nr:site-specific DNA-methyltransferase [Gammaproteobacteria bacterium]